MRSIARSAKKVKKLSGLSPTLYLATSLEDSTLSNNQKEENVDSEELDNMPIDDVIKIDITSEFIDNQIDVSLPFNGGGFQISVIRIFLMERKT